MTSAIDIVPLNCSYTPTEKGHLHLEPVLHIFESVLSRPENFCLPLGRFILLPNGSGSDVELEARIAPASGTVIGSCEIARRDLPPKVHPEG